MFTKKKKKPQISHPTNFEHRVHTGFDKREGKFVGLPLQWASIVGNNQILKSTNRPLPLVDPSEITPTEILDLKVGFAIYSSPKQMRSHLNISPSFITKSTFDALLTALLINRPFPWIVIIVGSTSPRDMEITCQETEKLQHLLLHLMRVSRYVGQGFSSIWGCSWWFWVQSTVWIVKLCRVLSLSVKKALSVVSFT